jgi:hypothetical protein
MTRPAPRALLALCGVIGLLAGAAAAAGVLLRGDGSTARAVSIRGEAFEYVTSGVYAYNPVRVVAEGVGWDYVTLLLVAPALLLALPSLARGSLRGRLFALGLLAYLFYQYLMYAVFWALGPLFPVFVALYAASMAAIVWIAAGIDLGSLPAAFGARFPRRAMAMFSFLVGGLLVAMWSKRIYVGLSGDLAGAGRLGLPTLTVQALDLGIVVPLAVFTAVALRRSRPVGYLLAPMFAVKGTTMGAAICAMLLSAWAVEGRLEVVPLLVFAAVTLASGALGWRMFVGARDRA